jgi:hypothetical protein
MEISSVSFRIFLCEAYIPAVRYQADLTTLESIKYFTIMEIMYKQKAEPGKQCQECQSFTVNPSNPAAGTCFGKDVVAEGGCMFFKAREVSGEAK